MVPFSYTETPAAPHQILVGSELAGLLPRRNAFSHKTDFGRLTLIAGSPGFTGAPVLCAQAAQAMGAGLLSVVTRAEVTATVAASSPHEAMVSGWPEKGGAPSVVRNATALAIGPGLGVDDQTTEMLRAALAVGCPVVIDADALNALAKNLDLLHEARGPVVLTTASGRDDPFAGS